MSVRLLAEEICLKLVPTWSLGEIDSLHEAIRKDKNRATITLKKCFKEQQQLKEKIKQCKEEIWMRGAEESPDMLQFSQERVARIIHLSFHIAEVKIVAQRQRNALIVLNHLDIKLLLNPRVSHPIINFDRLILSNPVLPQFEIQADVIHPYWQDTKYYPQLGRMLEEKDKGQRIVRLVPEKYGLYAYDWSFVPKHNEKESSIDNISEVELENIFEEELIIKGFVQKFKNDGCWCTLDEFKTFRKLYPESAMSLREAESYLRVKKIREGETMTRKKHREDQASLISTSTEPRPLSAKTLPQPPEHPGCVDYSFYPPLEKSVLCESTHNSPNFSSNNPYEVLGLDPSEKNPKVINKHYKTLALLYHPDKPCGDTDKFKKLSKAHGQLLRECLLHPFQSFAVMQETDVSTQFADALQYFDELQKKTIHSKRQIEEILPVLEIFIKELDKMNITINTSKDELLILLHSRLRNSAGSFLNFYQIKLQILNMDVPASFLDVKTRMDAIEKHMDTLSQINLQCDHWNYDVLNYLIDLRLSILDKYVAFTRSKGELILYCEHDRRKYQRMVQEYLTPWIAASHASLARQTAKLLWQDAAFKSEMQKLSASKIVFSKTSDAFPHSDGLKTNEENNSSFKEISINGEIVPEEVVTICIKQKTKVDPFTLKKEIEALHKNIEANHSALKEIL